MLAHCASTRLTLALTLLTLLTPSASGQSKTTRPTNSDKESVATEAPPIPNQENKGDVDAPPKPNDLESQVSAVKAENAAFREALRKMEEQQKTLLEMVERLQKKLDDTATANVQGTGQPMELPTTASASAKIPLTGTNTGNLPLPTSDAVDASTQPASVVSKQGNDDHYEDGIIVWKNPEDAKVPFLLKFNVNTQIRYLNTQNSKETFTDHLGVVREVHSRNDITVNRTMFILGGYMFSKKLQYSMTVWTSAGAASIVVAGNIGWRFNKALTVTGGYTGVPGSRSLVGTFPFFQPIDRSMADNFFRPGFTQGVWANGEPAKGLNYLVFVGNGLNTLNITANKIDTSLLFSGSVWWEPFGAYSEPGKSRQMYDDYFASPKTRIRIGTSFTRSREDRFSDTDQSSPDNTSIYNSDGVLAFSTGAFAPGVTLQKATYRMWAIDGGLKKSGFSVNGQYYLRWLNDFEADGPLPLASTFDHGFELSTGKFIVPKKLMLYVRGSKVFGQFANPSEYGGGFKWYFLPTERLWMTGEIMRVNHSPYSGAFTPYTAGMNGWMPMLQTVLAF
ncbi:MAG TPA: hypothetical protein VLB68_27275 [Pyrinomonadaceae bacterium]|nr:hypothetical protein [Pyrinomonadaceae bacterium]